MDRRRFLAYAGCAACALGVEHGLHGPRSAAAAQAYDALDPAARLNLADMALDLAKAAGASYADVRIGRIQRDFIRARERRLEEFEAAVTVGFGVRVLIDGSWGFAGSQVVSEDEITRAVALAADNAKAARLIQANPIVLETVPAYQEDWVMPMQRDPFAVSASDKAAKLVAINEAALKAGADYCTAFFSFVREETLFASSRGSRIAQTRVRSYPRCEATAVDKQSGRFATRASLVAPRGAGWDYIEGLDLLGEATLAAQQAREKLAAKPVTPGKYDLVIDPTNLWLTIHESVGHSTELDRALGWEANFAGTSFVTPDKLGKLKFGSALMNVTADRSQPGGLATTAFDDDGVRCAGAEFPIIADGIFQNYQMAIGQAALIGRERSNGCAYADSPTAFPIQRMPNVSLEPNPQPTSLDDLFAGVDDGIYVVGEGSWSIDQQRYNFQFGGQLFYEIKNGKRGAMLRDVAYQGRTPDFWNAMDGLGDKSTRFVGGSFFCGKGQPAQLAPVSHGAVPARFRRINVLNTERQDI
ncbi:MAG TPA: TldD/PmbA family protein [Xanthobacteraceae bacterium]|nr:TldD/PmbA family protein [Xanthobacteraceae bacterium]